jgi:chloramphenicol 3-O-phosphotransferase
MTKKSYSYPPIADKIIHELYRSVELLGADEQLLALIGSWNETLPDKTVLEGLQFWIKCKKEEMRRQKKQKQPRKAGVRKSILKGTRK